MHIDAEFLLNQLRQLTRPDWLAWRQLCDEKRQHLALNFVRPCGPRLCGTRPAMPASSKSALAW